VIHVASAELARQAEIGLLARPAVRAGILTGKTIVDAQDRILYTANGRGGVVDEIRLQEVQHLVTDLPIGLRAPRRRGVGLRSQ
jgi:hypothetical protein